MFQKISAKTIVVIEDIDRSGDAGAYFLETLNNFLNNIELNNKIIAVVPMGTDRHNEHVVSFSKSIHYVHEFDPLIKSVDKFIERVFRPELFIESIELEGGKKSNGDIRRQQLKSLLLYILNSQHVNIRLLKRILRSAEARFVFLTEQKQNPYWLLVIAVEISNHLPVNSGCKDYISDMKKFWREKNIQADNLIGCFIAKIQANQPSLTEAYPPSLNELDIPKYGIKLVDRINVESHSSYIWFKSDAMEEGWGPAYCICSFYFEP